jgi:hypothetical protein
MGLTAIVHEGVIKKRVSAGFEVHIPGGNRHFSRISSSEGDVANS